MEVSRIVLGLRPEPEVVGRTVSQLFDNIEHETDEPGRRESLEAFFRELSRLVINWMATSDERVLREVYTSILRALHELPASHPANRYLQDAEWLGVRLRGLLILITTYLTTGNLAKSLGHLTGRRRERWRRAIERMGRRPRRPVRTGTLVEEGIFPQETTANNALNRMVELGLLEKRTVGGAVLFGLTWAGENVARFLNSAAEADVDLDDEPEEVTPEPRWRRAFERMARSPRRFVGAGTLVEEGIFPREMDAGYALDRMAELRLLDKRAEGDAITFGLTPAGVGLARALASAEMEVALQGEAAQREPASGPSSDPRASYDFGWLEDLRGRTLERV